MELFVLEKMKRRSIIKKAIFGSLGLTLSCIFGIGLLIIADLYMHYHLREQQGYNSEGYRGESLDRKREGEVRIATFGGSTTYGYGVNYKKAWPYYLSVLLQDNVSNQVSVTNLGANNQGIYGIWYDVRAYNYLGYDIALMFNGYNDSNPKTLNLSSFRGDDGFFQIFGYKFILPMYLSEKSALLMYGDENLDKHYRGELEENVKQEGIRFQVGLAMKEMNTLIGRVERFLYEQEEIAEGMLQASGDRPFKEYLQYLEKVFDWLLTHEKVVIFVCQPGMYDSVQQSQVRQLIHNNYKGQVTYINLSEAIDLSDKELSFDNMHLTPLGNKIIAEHINNSIRPLISNHMM